MKILMIEDQRIFSEMMVHLLEGLKVDVAETLAAARARLAESRYDMVLVDLGLPDSQGVNTLRALREYKVPKVVLTGRFDVSAEIAGECTDFITKTDTSEIYERVMFNVSKIQKAKKPRFSPAVFDQIRACFEHERVEALELTTA